MRFPMAVCLLIIGVGVGPSSVEACDCAPPPPPKEAMEKSAAVFLAEVVKVEDGRAEGRMVTLKVERWWKGGDSVAVTVSTAKDGAACGYNFQKGNRYLVYAHAQAKDRPLRVSLCSRTRTAKEAEASGDFKELGGEKAPSSPPDPLIPVRVTAAAEPADPDEAPAIPLAVTIHNGLKGEIRHSSYVLEPNAWNGETANLTLVDVYRDGEKGGLFRARPAIDAPLAVSGMASHPIGPGKALTIRTNARKWDIGGGWKPGKYRATVRVENLAVDGGRCLLSVQSAPFEFEVK